MAVLAKFYGFLPASVSSSFLIECHVLSLFCGISSSLVFIGMVCVAMRVCFVCTYGCVSVCVGGKDQCFLWRDNELTRWVMNCGDMMEVAGHANQLIRFCCSTEVCTFANLEETLIIRR